MDQKLYIQMKIRKSVTLESYVILCLHFIAYFTYKILWFTYLEIFFSYTCESLVSNPVLSTQVDRVAKHMHSGVRCSNLI